MEKAGIMLFEIEFEIYLFWTTSVFNLIVHLYVACALEIRSQEAYTKLYV